MLVQVLKVLHSTCSMVKDIKAKHSNHSMQNLIWFCHNPNIFPALPVILFYECTNDINAYNYLQYNFFKCVFFSIRN